MSPYVSCCRCDLEVGAHIDNKYIVDKELGEGTFGKVYRVRQATGSNYLALKLLKLWTVEAAERLRLLKRFDQEYETGCIKSDYLVQSFGNGSLQGNPYIVMEYCPGGDLFRHAEETTVDFSKTASEVLLGLRDLHVNGKVHRDLKPENVLIRANGAAALTDFSIAGDRNKRLTERGVLGAPKEVFGTYAYMPPEQVNPQRGEATVLPTTDIFSFGVMMFQLLTGVLPFGPLNEENDLYAYVSRGRKNQWDREQLEENAAMRQWLPLIEGCLRADFRCRLQSAEEALALVPAVPTPLQRHMASSRAAAPSSKGVALRVMQGEEYGKVYHLNDLLPVGGRRLLTMGRNADDIHNDIAIKEVDSAYISRKHCTLEYNPTSYTWRLRDGQWDMRAMGRWKVSVNGTYIDSREVSTSGMDLTIGDIISIGDVKLRVEGY